MKFIPFVIKTTSAGFELKAYDIDEKLTFTDAGQLKQFIGDDMLVSFRPSKDALKAARIETYCDLSQDMDDSLTLKAIFAHVGWCEFEELEMVDKLLDYRRAYLENKIELARLGGLDWKQCLTMTEPQLMAVLLGASARSGFDESFDTPACIKWDEIPKCVSEFFSSGAGGTCETEIGNLKVTYGQGGIHGAIPKYQSQVTDTNRLWLVDVSSMYPSMMIEYGYVSRAVRDSQALKRLLDKRIESKKTNPQLANALKGPLNKTYGAMRSKYNALYDPTMAFAVCIAGQLVMTMLLTRLSLIEGLRLVQVNTDGVLIEFDATHADAVQGVLTQWQADTHLKLETTNLKYIIQKDVSNYIAQTTDNVPKLKGAVFARGVSEVGAWKINNNMYVVSDAVARYFAVGVEPEVTINECDNPFQFQIISNVSDKYAKVIHETIKGDVELGRVNRVFATTNHKLGSLKKAKGKGKTKEQIANLPVHCMVCNTEYPQMSEIDKEFYIQHAKKIIESFGCKPYKKVTVIKKMTNKNEGLNVYQRLAKARSMFLEIAPQKSGWNKYLEFSYYQLEDIVPVQTQVFAEVGLIEKFTYHKAKMYEADANGNVVVEPAVARSEVINIDDPADVIVFENLWIEDSVKGQSIIQAYGSMQTYLRRYNKLQILDLVEFDTVDGSTGMDAPQTKVTTKAKTNTKAPATPQKREEIKQALTGKDKPADDVLIEQIKKAMSTLKKEFADREEYKAWVKQAPKPKDLSNFTQAQAKEFLHKAGELREQLTKEA